MCLFVVAEAKMTENPMEKAYCVLEFAKTQSATAVQGHFRTRFHKLPPNTTGIKNSRQRDVCCAEERAREDHVFQTKTNVFALLT